MSLFILDTDILSLYQRAHPAVCRHMNAHSPSDLAVTVISVEEQLSGWYVRLRAVKRRDQLAAIYDRLAITVQSLSRLPILGFPETAILRYEYLVTLKLNIGKKDPRIAAITLDRGGILVTRNLRDFRRVPNLTTEDWTF